MWGWGDGIEQVILLHKVGWELKLNVILNYSYFSGLRKRKGDRAKKEKEK